MQSYNIARLAAVLCLFSYTNALPGPREQAKLSTIDKAGPQPESNSTHSVAITNEFGTTEPYWVHIPREGAPASTTTRSLEQDTLEKRQLWPSFVNVYNAGPFDPDCEVANVNQFNPANTHCTCIQPFNGGQQFTEVFVSSDTQGFTANIYGDNGGFHPANCDNFQTQLFQFSGCFVNTLAHYSGITFFNTAAPNLGC